MPNTLIPTFTAGFALLALVIVGNASFFLWDPAPLQLIRNNTFDQFQRLKPRTYQDTPVKIIDIDDESLKRLGQWPWPRTQIAKLISILQTAKPSAIGLDIIFAEKDRTSPEVMRELWKLSPTEQQLLSHLPDHDQTLAASLRNSRSILGFALNHTLTPLDAPTMHAHFIQIGSPVLPYLHAYTGIIKSLPMLEATAKGYGALTYVPDAGGVIRKIPVALGYHGQIVPTLLIECLRIAQNTSNYVLRSHDRPLNGLAEIQVGNIRIPTTEQGEIWLHYSKPVDTRYIPAWQIFEGQFDIHQLKDQILLIGTSAPGVMDLRFSPLGNIIPGIEIHAQALEEILNQTQLIRPVWHTSAEILASVLGGLLIGIITLRNSILLSALTFVLAQVGIWSIGWHAFAEYRCLISPIEPAIMLLATFLCSSLFRHLVSERNQRWIKDAFSRYLSPNLVDYLVRHPEELELSSHKRVCSFVFTDLSDFTSMMESLDPNQAASVLNDYLENMIAIAFTHQGTLDRIVGDSVAIMFSAPIPQHDHQRRAMQCALDMLTFSIQFRDRLAAEGIAFGQTRIGVHSGEVIVGNFGGKTIFDYRALGDPVNTASRLESANKYLGTLICVSEAVFRACPEFPARPIGHLLVKGKSHPLKVYEPLSPASFDPKFLSEYETAYRLMQDKRPVAVSALQRFVAEYPDDKLAHMHLQRLLDGKSGDLIELNHK